MGRTALILASLLCICATGLTRADVIYDAAADFSPTMNPNGVWSYGQSAMLTSAFAPFTNTVKEFAQIDSWNAGAGVFLNPSVSHNPSAGVVNVASLSYQPGQLGFHPGMNGQFGVIRFVAPAAGDYALDVAFSGLDQIGPTTSDVHVLLNNASLFNGLVNAFGPGPSFMTNLNLSAGDIVDFKVGVGNNGTFNFDTTGINAQLTLRETTVPEPGSLAVFGLTSLIAICQMRRRK